MYSKTQKPYTLSGSGMLEGRSVMHDEVMCATRMRCVSPGVSGVGFHGPAELPSTISTM